MLTQRLFISNYFVVTFDYILYDSDVYLITSSYSIILNRYFNKK